MSLGAGPGCVNLAHPILRSGAVAKAESGEARNQYWWTAQRAHNPDLEIRFAKEGRVGGIQQRTVSTSASHRIAQSKPIAWNAHPATKKQSSGTQIRTGEVWKRQLERADSEFLWHREVMKAGSLPLSLPVGLPSSDKHSPSCCRQPVGTHHRAPPTPQASPSALGLKPADSAPLTPQYMLGSRLCCSTTIHTPPFLIAFSSS